MLVAKWCWFNYVGDNADDDVAVDDNDEDDDDDEDDLTDEGRYKCQEHFTSTTIRFLHVKLNKIILQKTIYGDSCNEN